jgi:hypothetical protein
MILKIKSLTIFIIAVIGFTSFADAQITSREKTFQLMTKRSQKIVRGYINSHTAISFEDEGIKLHCGYILEINVNKGWKGGEDSFKVFSPHSDVLLGDNYEYVIFARQNAYFNPSKPKLDFLNCDNLNSTRMDVSGFEYFATSLKQQIFPLVNYDGPTNIINEDTNMVKKGEWMLLVNRLSNDHIPFSIERRRLNIDNDKILEEMSLKDFIREFLN